MTKPTPKRKPLSALARLTASHMRLLKLLRGQIQELGELRKVILDMQPPKEFEVPPPEACKHTNSHGWGSIGPNGWDGQSWCDKCGKQLTFSTAKSAVKPVNLQPNDWPRL